MSNLVIVAIPEEDDLVWTISSEKIPHLTLCFLGEADQVQNKDRILDFLEHAANTVLTRFYLDVDKRGTLGLDEADVIFFNKGWDLPVLKEFRGFLLKDDNIFKAYNAVEQYPEWQPHLTLGYPKKPAAKLDKGERIYSVRFNRVALWYGNYEGPEFELKDYDFGMEASMSSVVEDILSHHGIKGMKWGRRKAETPSGTVAVTTKVTEKGRAQIEVAGGKGFEPHPDATKAATIGQIRKQSGVHALSNKDLQALKQRLELEQQVSRLTAPQKTGANKFISDLLSSIGKQQANQYGNRKIAAVLAEK